MALQGIERSDIVSFILIELISAFLGAISGLVTYMLYLLFTFDTFSHESFVELFVDLISGTPLGAVYVGATTFAIAIPILYVLSGDVTGLDGFDAYLYFLGASTFTGFVGATLGYIIHVIRSIGGLEFSSLKDFLLSLLILLAEALTGGTLDMVIVGFMTPIVFIIVVSILFGGYIFMNTVEEFRQ